MVQQHRQIGWLLVPLCWILCAPCQADLIKLKNGGEVRGTFVRKYGKVDTKQPVTIETLTGGIVTVDPSEFSFVATRQPKVEEYETRRRSLPDTVEAHWGLAEWCRENNLNKERSHHLEAVVRLDPEHEAAHRGLGHIFRKGEWTTMEAFMQSQGYVHYKGRWVIPEERDLLEQKASENEAEREWYKKIHVWKGWLQSGDFDKRYAAEAELEKIDDTHAVRPLVRQLSAASREEVRELLIELLIKLGGQQAFEGLVYQSLRDPSSILREKALNGIPSEGRAVAISYYVKELRNDVNVVVLRSAAALQKLGDDQAIPALIEALVTEHRYRIQVPTRSGTTVSMSPQGFASAPILPPEVEQALLTGQIPGVIVLPPVGGPQPVVKMKTVTVIQQHRNTEVLNALKTLSGENYGFDERTWRLWYASTKTTKAI